MIKLCCKANNEKGSGYCFKCNEKSRDDGLIYTHFCKVCDYEITREDYQWAELCTVCTSDIYSKLDYES